MFAPHKVIQSRALLLQENCRQINYAINRLLNAILSKTNTIESPITATNKKSLLVKNYFQNGPQDPNMILNGINRHQKTALSSIGLGTHINESHIKLS